MCGSIKHFSLSSGFKLDKQLYVILSIDLAVQVDRIWGTVIIVQSNLKVVEPERESISYHETAADVIKEVDNTYLARHPESQLHSGL